MQKFYIIIGPPRNGKTTIAKIISNKTGLRHGSTSSVVCAALIRDLGVTIEEFLSKPKEENRPLLTKKGNELCEQNKTYLIDALVKDNINIIDGARRVLELSQAQQKLSKLGQLTTIWVENPRVEHIADNTEVTASMADVVIVNDGTIPELEQKVLAALEL